MNQQTCRVCGGSGIELEHYVQSSYPPRTIELIRICSVCLGSGRVVFGQKLANKSTSMTETNPTLLSDFLEQLEAAVEALEEADAFDVDSRDPTSLSLWRTLLAKEAAAMETLIDLVQRDAEALRAQVRRLVE